MEEAEYRKYGYGSRWDLSRPRLGDIFVGDDSDIFNVIIGVHSKRIVTLTLFNLSERDVNGGSTFGVGPNANVVFWKLEDGRFKKSVIWIGNIVAASKKVKQDYEPEAVTVAEADNAALKEEVRVLRELLKEAVTELKYARYCKGDSSFSAIISQAEAAIQGDNHGNAKNQEG